MPKLNLEIGEDISLPKELEKYVKDNKITVYVGNDVAQVVAPDLNNKISALEGDKAALETEKSDLETAKTELENQNKNYLTTNANLAKKVENLEATLSEGTQDNPFEKTLKTYGKPDEIKAELEEYKEQKPVLKEYRAVKLAEKVAQDLKTDNITVVRDRIHNSNGVTFEERTKKDDKDKDKEVKYMVAIVPKEDSDEKDEIEVSKFVESSDIWKPYLSLLTEKTDNKRKPYT